MLLACLLSKLLLCMGCGTKTNLLLKYLKIPWLRQPFARPLDSAGIEKMKVSESHKNKIESQGAL